MRLLILEIVDGETTGKRVVWLLLTATQAQRWQSLVRRDTVDHCAEALSTMMIKGGTPMRLLILETIDGEIIGKRAAWSLSAATWARHCPL